MPRRAARLVHSIYDRRRATPTRGSLCIRVRSLLAMQIWWHFVSALVIDARLQFGLARMRASAQRATLADAAEVEVDIELLDSELRASGEDWGPFAHDMDGRFFE